MLADKLRADGKNPYVIPVGGSNALGTWGYMMTMEELYQQTNDDRDSYTHIISVQFCSH